jgi:hypothetical protein
MKTKEEIEQLADKAINKEGYTTDDFIIGFEQGYTQCQEDVKKILLDFIEWSKAVDEYGNKLDENDINNFLNKQD